jgi:hypothetical protein
VVVEQFVVRPSRLHMQAGRLHHKRPGNWPTTCPAALINSRRIGIVARHLLPQLRESAMEQTGNRGG